MEIRVLSVDDLHVLDTVAEDVFDDAIRKPVARAFLADERHHLVVAVEDDEVIGFVSAVHYLHPDKAAPELWINELGVTPGYRRQGIARGLLKRLLSLGAELGCADAWVLAEPDNRPALELYASMGKHVPRERAVMFTLAVQQGVKTAGSSV